MTEQKKDRRLKQYLKKELHYTEREIRHTEEEIRRMDPAIRSWLEGWLAGEGFSEERIEGVTARELMEHSQWNLNPVSVFLALDWLKKDPASARHILSQMPEEFQIGQGTLEEMEQKAQCLKERRRSDEGGASEDSHSGGGGA